MLSASGLQSSQLPPTLRGLSKNWALAFCVVVLLAATRSSLALPLDLSLSQIQHTTWTAKQGAPADIWTLAQSADGFLLLGTGSGLYRFDGVTFERIVPSNHPDLAFRDITALLALPSGELWIGYYAGGVSELKNGVLSSYDIRQGVPSGWITSFAQERDGTLWVAALEGLGRFSGGHWETISSDWNFRGHEAHWVLLDHEGTLWVAGGETVKFLPRGSHRFEDTEIRSGYKSTLALASDGTVWLGGESVSPRPLTTHDSVLVRGEASGRLEPVRRFLVDREGSIWATLTEQGGIYRVTPRHMMSSAAKTHSSIETLSESDGLTSNIAVPLFEDHDGNIWVGTNLGLNRFHTARFVRESRVPTSPTNYSLAADPSGSVWIASGKQLFEVDGSKCDLVATLPSPIRSAYRDPSGTVWFGTEESLVELVDKKPKSLPLPASALSIQYQYVHAMTVDPSHRLLVSVINRGVLRLHGRQWDLAPESAASEITPTALWTDVAGRQWFGYSDGTALLRAGDRTQVFSAAQGLQVGPILVIRESGQDVFIGGEWGLARFDGRSFRSLSASRAEAFSGISGIIIRANGDIWLNGNRGVVRMSPDALTDAYDHPARKLRYELFDIHDGLPGYAQQGEDASAVAGADGRLWFATNHGVAWIEPDHIATHGMPPHAVIRSVVADQRTFESAGRIVLPEATRSVRIDYTAPSLAEPERVRFRYKLEGAEDTWRDANTERSVRYANLSPGNYVFRVIAANDGVWSDVGATLPFTLRPAFYQTSWFLVLISAACLGILWVSWWARLRQVTRKERVRFEQRMEDRLSERTRVARELHDTLLQSFQGLLLRFQVAYELLPARPSEAKQDLGKAIDRTVRAINEGRDAVQGLRTSVDGDDLAAAIKTLAEELTGDHYGRDVVFRMDLQGTPQPLVPMVRDEIYQIAGEALRNARRHAQASEIEVELRYDEGQLRLRIRDNGTGIDQKFLSGERATGHYGLHGQRERATLIGGKLAIWTAPSLGTEIELTVPAQRAYATATAMPLTRLLKRLSRKISAVTHE